jgi:hypothetical protein
MQLEFGAGSCWATPQFDSTGSAVANPTPVRFGILQDFSFGVEFGMKELFSRYQMPIAVARSSAKVTWKASWARISAHMYNAVFFGNTGLPAAGAQVYFSDGEARTVPGSPYGITTTNAANFLRDLGVRYQTDNSVLSLTNAAPATGQYIAAPAGAPDWTASTSFAIGSFIKPLTSNAGGYVYMALSTATSGGSAPVWTQTVGATVTDSPNWLCIGVPGAYLFAAGDTTKVVKIDYQYTSTVGYLTTINSQELGSSPSFMLVARGKYNGAPITVRLNNCVSGKLSLPRKVDDWVLQAMDGDAFADGSNIVGYISLNEAL